MPLLRNLVQYFSPEKAKAIVGEGEDGGYVPLGTVIMAFRSTAPTGYLFADGQAISRTTYAELFAIFGTAYGTGDGSTTFNIPDMRQRFPLGKSASGTGSTLGGVGGTIDHVHSVPGHAHNARGPGATIQISASGAHTHAFESPVHKNIAGSDALQGTNLVAANSILSATHTHSNTDFTGYVGNLTSGIDGDYAFNTASSNPPFMAVNFLIRVL